MDVILCLPVVVQGQLVQPLAHPPAIFGGAVEADVAAEIEQYTALTRLCAQEGGSTKVRKVLPSRNHQVLWDQCYLRKI
jgi:hypothetical protein